MEIEIAALQESNLYLWLQHHRDWVGPTIIALAFIESFALIGVLIPGVVLLSTAAFAASVIETKLWLVVMSAYIGANLGDAASFALGRLSRRHKHIQHKLLRRKNIIRAQLLFRRYSSASLIIARFIGPARPVMPFIAGLMRMPALRFITIVSMTGIVWAPLYTLPGYWLATSIMEKLPWETLLTILLVAGGALGLFFFLMRHGYRRQSEKLKKTNDRHET